MKKEKLTKKELEDFIEMSKNEIVEWWDFIDTCKRKLKKINNKKK